jgi:hypothetical protein
MTDDPLNLSLFSGLKALADSSFPRNCPSCGKRYENLEDYIRNTDPAPGHFRADMDDDGSYLVECYRNCRCGSTMVEFCQDRRDRSEQGLRRRQKFGELMERLTSRGVPQTTARQFLLNVVHSRVADPQAAVEALVAKYASDGEEDGQEASAR